MLRRAIAYPPPVTAQDIMLVAGYRRLVVWRPIPLLPDSPSLLWELSEGPWRNRFSLREPFGPAELAEPGCRGFDDIFSSLSVVAPSNWLCYFLCPHYPQLKCVGRSMRATMHRES